MPTTAHMPEPRQRYFKDNGQPAAGYKLYTYAAGTTTLKQAFQDSAGTIPHTNPIVLDARGEATIYWSGAYKVELRTPGGVTVPGYPVDNFKSDPHGVIAFIASLAASAGSSLMGFIQAGAGAVLRTVQDKLRGIVDAKDFGAVCDGVTDDSAAVQLAVNYCLTFTRPKALRIPGRCRLASSVNIDRLVDTAIGKLRIIGEGDGAGFYVDSAVTMFDSTLAVTTAPQSEFVRFENLLFESSSTALAAYVLSKKFLRIEFDNCEFRSIRCMTSNIYVQDMWLTDCRIKDNPSSFITCDGLYHVTFRDCKQKFGNTLVSCVSTAIGTNGLHILNHEAEGVQTSILRVNGATVQIIGGHYEANKMPEFNFFVGGPTNNTIVIEGAYLYNPDSTTAGSLYYGATDSVISQGNTCFPNPMHVQISSVTNFVSISDKATALTLPAEAALITNTIGGIRTNADAARLNKIITTDDVGIGNDVVATVRAYIRGKGATSATFAMVVANGSGQDIAQFRDDKNVLLPALQNFANDAAAAAGGVPVAGLYRVSNAVQIRLV